MCARRISRFVFRARNFIEPARDFFLIFSCILRKSRFPDHESIRLNDGYRDSEEGLKKVQALRIAELGEISCGSGNEKCG